MRSIKCWMRKWVFLITQRNWRTSKERGIGKKSLFPNSKSWRYQNAPKHVFKKHLIDTCWVKVSGFINLILPSLSPKLNIFLTKRSSRKIVEHSTFAISTRWTKMFVIEIWELLLNTAKEILKSRLEQQNRKKLGPAKRKVYVYSPLWKVLVRGDSDAKMLQRGATSGVSKETEKQRKGTLFYRILFAVFCCSCHAESYEMIDTL